MTSVIEASVSESYNAVLRYLVSERRTKMQLGLISLS